MNNNFKKIHKLKWNYKFFNYMVVSIQLLYNKPFSVIELLYNKLSFRLQIFLQSWPQGHTNKIYIEYMRPQSSKLQVTSKTTTKRLTSSSMVVSFISCIKYISKVRFSYLIPYILFSNFFFLLCFSVHCVVLFFFYDTSLFFLSSLNTIVKHSILIL